MTDHALDPESAWAAVQRRDRTFDGRFVTGVLSTGIYCRPSCGARHPARRNVRFFADGAAARQAGLRACQRCRPDEVARDEAAVRAAIAAIGNGQGTTLAKLASLTGYSPTHLQRVFKQATGISAAAYTKALRDERTRDLLERADSVTQALYAAGYEAPSRFYDGVAGRLGMRPGEWRRGGAGQVIRFAIAPTSLGPMLVAATQRGVCCVSFGEGEAQLRRRFPKADVREGDADFAGLMQQVIAAVERPGTGYDIPLDVQGTAFQQRVWDALRAIPAGETRSYGQLAALLGNPKASRAVGGANGANKIAVLIPCHRVVAGDGTLGGYAYGAEIKAELLRRERDG